MGTADKDPAAAEADEAGARARASGPLPLAGAAILVAHAAPDREFAAWLRDALIGVGAFAVSSRLPRELSPEERAQGARALAERASVVVAVASRRAIDDPDWVQLLEEAGRRGAPVALATEDAGLARAAAAVSGPLFHLSPEVQDGGAGFFRRLALLIADRPSPESAERQVTRILALLEEAVTGPASGGWAGRPAAREAEEADDPAAPPPEPERSARAEDSGSDDKAGRLRDALSQVETARKQAARRKRSGPGGFGRRRVPATLAPPASPPAAPPPAPASSEPEPAVPGAAADDDALMDAAAAELAGGASTTSAAAGGGAAVSLSAFAPTQARPSGDFMVLAALHLPEQAGFARRMALQMDDAAEERGATALQADVSEGDFLSVEIEAPGLTLTGPRAERFRWRGAPVIAAFPVSAPFLWRRKRFPVTLRVLLGQAPIGRLTFTVEVTRRARAKAPDAVGAFERYRYAFLSYASEDRSVVSAVAASFARAGVPHFFDVDALRAGDDWEARLREEVQRADLFLVYWSEAAARSKWVAQEALWAKETRDAAPDFRPDIKPYALGPSAPTPPKSLGALHFETVIPL